MAASSNTSNRAPQRYNLRLYGPAPEIQAARSASMALVMDPRGCGSNTPISLSVRHGTSQVLSFTQPASNTATSLDLVMSIGDPLKQFSLGGYHGECNPGLSIRTPPKIVEIPAGVAVERVRIDADGLVVSGDVKLSGTFYASRYFDLIQDYEHPDAERPVSGTALFKAYYTLSNAVAWAVAAATCAGNAHNMYVPPFYWPGFNGCSNDSNAWSNDPWFDPSCCMILDSNTSNEYWSWMSNLHGAGLSNVCHFDSNCSNTSTPVPMWPPGFSNPGPPPGAGGCNQYAYPWWWGVGSNYFDTDRVTEVGPLSCTDLMVVAGGSVDAFSFCNLVQDCVIDASTSMPPSAYAVHSAIVNTSNIATCNVQVTNSNFFKWLWYQSSNDSQQSLFLSNVISFDSNSSNVIWSAPYSNPAINSNGEIVRELFTVSSDGVVTASGGYSNLPIATDQGRSGIVLGLSTSIIDTRSNYAATPAAVAALHDRVIAYAGLEQARSVSASNAAVFACNSAVYSCNQLINMSNGILFSSNSAVNATSNIGWMSNSLFWLSNTLVPTSNYAFAPSNLRVTGSISVVSSASHGSQATFTADSNNALFVPIFTGDLYTNLVQTYNGFGPAASTTRPPSAAALSLSFSGAMASNAAVGSAAVFSSNLAVSISNVLYPRSAFACNAALQTSNALFPQSQFTSNLAVAMSNSLFPLTSATQFTAAATSNTLFGITIPQVTFTCNQMIATSNTLFPNTAFSSNLSVMTSNQLYPRTDFSSNLVTSCSNILFPRSLFASNVAATTSNDLYASCAFSSNLVVITSNIQFPKSSFASNLSIDNSNKLYPTSIFTCNLAISSSNLLFSTANFASNTAVVGSNVSAVTSNVLFPQSLFSSNAIVSLSNYTYPVTSFTCNLAIATSNALFPRSLFSSNIGVSTSNDLYPRSAFSCNLSVAMSNVLYAQSAFSSNLVVINSNLLFPSTTFSSNLSVSTSNVIYPQAAFSSNCAVFASNLGISSSNSAFPLAFFSCNTAMSASNATIASSNAAFPVIFSTSNLATRTSNDLYPKSVFGCNLSISISNTIYPQSSFSSNLVVSNSNALFPLSGFACNLAITTSNDLYTRSAFGSNLITQIQANSNDLYSKSSFSSNLGISTSNDLYPKASFASNVGAITSNLLFPLLAFTCNLTISTSNALYPSSRFSSNLAVNTSNILFPQSAFACNLAISTSNALYPSCGYSSNLATLNSNTLYPRSEFSSNMSVNTSNSLYPSCAFSSNLCVTTSNLLTAQSAFASNGVVALSNSVFPIALFASNTSWATSNDLYTRTVFLSNLSVSTSNQIFPAIFYASNISFVASNDYFPKTIWTCNALVPTSNALFADVAPRSIWSSNTASFSSNLSVLTSNSLYPQSSFASNLAVANSNSIFPQATFSSNLSVATSNFVYPSTMFLSNLSVATSNYSYPSLLFTSNLVVTSSNDLYPMAAFSSNLSVSNSNTLFPMSIYGCNLSVTSSNDLYPRSEWGCNLAVSNSNVLYPKSSYGCNLTVTSSNELYPMSIYGSNLSVASSNYLYPTTNWASNTSFWSCNASVYSSNTVFATSNVVYAPTQNATTINLQSTDSNGAQSPRMSLCNSFPTTSILSLTVRSAGIGIGSNSGKGGVSEITASRVPGPAAIPYAPTSNVGGDMSVSADGATVIKSLDGSGFAQTTWSSQAAAWGWPSSNTGASMEWPPGGLGLGGGQSLAALLGQEPVALTNVPYGLGPYGVTASSTANSNGQSNAPFSPLYAFSRCNLLGNGPSNAAWVSLPGYTSVTGWAFQPSMGADRSMPSTTVDGISRNGDWIQLDTPEPIVPTSYVIAPAINAIDGQPVRFVLAARAFADGPWTTIDSTYATQDYAPLNAVISVTPSALSTTANTVGASNGIGGFTSIRLIILRVNVTSTPPAAMLPTTVCGFQIFAKSTVATFGQTKRASVVTGSLGLGTCAPVQRLDVRGMSSFSSNVGIGVTSPIYQLQLSRDSAAKPASSTWTVLSDARLKTNVQPADLKRCYDIVKETPLNHFTWKDSVLRQGGVNDAKKLGWIAQDVEKSFPKAVQRQSIYGISDCRSLDSDQLIAALYGAVQHLQKGFEKLQQQQQRP